MKTRLKAAAAAVLVQPSVPGSARAQGIPVIDIANLIQTILQVLNDVTEINNQVQQITQLQDQLNSINGIRNLGNVFNNPMLKNYVPAEAYTYLNAINTSGYSGLNATAKALRDVGMVYNCMDLAGDARTSCQAALAQPYQQKGLLQDAMKSAAGRLSQIQSLMGQINATRTRRPCRRSRPASAPRTRCWRTRCRRCRCCRAWPTARSASPGRASVSASTRCSRARARWPTTFPDP
jgi:type IV secretion system protein VirB5